MEHITVIRLMVFFTMPSSGITYYKIRPAWRDQDELAMALYYQESKEIYTLAEGQDYLDKSDAPDWLKNVATIASKDTPGEGATLVFWTRASPARVYQVCKAQAKHYEKFRAKTSQGKKAVEKKQLQVLEAKAQKLGLKLVPMEVKA